MKLSPVEVGREGLPLDQYPVQAGADIALNEQFILSPDRLFEPPEFTPLGRKEVIFYFFTDERNTVVGAQSGGKQASGIAKIRATLAEIGTRNGIIMSQKSQKVGQVGMKLAMSATIAMAVTADLFTIDRKEQLMQLRLQSDNLSGVVADP